MALNLPVTPGGPRGTGSPLLERGQDAGNSGDSSETQGRKQLEDHGGDVWEGDSPLGAPWGCRGGDMPKRAPGGLSR